LSKKIKKKQKIECAVKGCNLNAAALIRSFDVCNKCFEVLKEDNEIRIKNGLNIPKSLAVTKELIKKMKSKSSKSLFKENGFDKFEEKHELVKKE